MGPVRALKNTLDLVRFMSVAGVVWLSSAFPAAAQSENQRLQSLSEDEFQAYFGVNRLDYVLGQSTNQLAFALRDKSIAELPPEVPVLLERNVLPAAFAVMQRPAVPEPVMIEAGDKGEPELSPLDCAVRAHSRHNLAFRCNAPVALNVPGGDKPRASFLREMVNETGMSLGTDIWPGDKDALTGDRLLSARDVVTGMRFTLRYLDQRGFTLGNNPCSNKSKWRWSYICLDDAAWDKMSRAEQCSYVLDNLLSVEGGSATWYFAPMPGPKSKKGDLISVGYSRDPRKIQTASALCQELAIQERVDGKIAAFITKTARKSGLKRVALNQVSKADLSLAMRIDGKEQIVGRFSAKNAQKLAVQRAALEASWRALGGSRLCLSANCNEPVEVALPPLPDYRPAQLREDKAPTLMQLLSQISG